MTDATTGASPTGQSAPRVYAGVMSECRNMLRESICAALTLVRTSMGEDLLSNECHARGGRIELLIEDAGTRTVRLTWVSPARTMYLFANRQGQRAQGRVQGLIWQTGLGTTRHIRWISNE